MAILSVFVGILAVNNPQVREKLRNIDQETIAGQRMQADGCEHEKRMNLVYQNGV